MVVPNFFILGAPKAGTTALAQYIGEHEDAFVSTPKEPFYLCDDFPHLREQHALRDDDDYLALFDGGAGCTAVGEASTNYLRSRVAVERALEFDGESKFICLLRDPADLAHAFHGEQVYARNEVVGDFEAAWRLQEERRAGQNIPPSCRAPEFLQYASVARIGTQLERAIRQVPDGQLLILFQADLASDTQAVYSETCEFLGLTPDGRTDFPRANSSHAHRSELLANLVLSPPAPLVGPVNRVRQYFRLQRPWLIERIKDWQKMSQGREAISPEFRQELVEFFAEEVLLVEKLTGRSPATWTRSENLGHGV